MGIIENGESASTALQKYGILTIGDGLVSQLPSLMISLATGVLVTKLSKEADLGKLLVKQLFGVPRVLYIVGGSLAVLGIITPLPWYVFCMYGRNNFV